MIASMDQRFDTLDCKIANVNELIMSQQIRLNEVTQMMGQLCQQIGSMHLPANPSPIVRTQSSAVTIVNRPTHTIYHPIPEQASDSLYPMAFHSNFLPNTSEISARSDSTLNQTCEF